MIFAPLLSPSRPPFSHLPSPSLALTCALSRLRAPSRRYERLTKEGIAFSTVTAGKYKRTLTPTKKIDAADLAKTKEDIENVLSLFRGWVAENRPQVSVDEMPRLLAPSPTVPRLR